MNYIQQKVKDIIDGVKLFYEGVKRERQEEEEYQEQFMWSYPKH